MAIISRARARKWLLLAMMLMAVVGYAQDEEYPDSDKSIVRVVITPSQVEISPGQKVQFYFTAFDADDQEVPAAFSWTFGGGRLQHNGIYTAGYNPGEYVLEARISTGVKGTALIKIKEREGHRVPVSLKVFPPYVELKPGQQQRFQFEATNRYGKTISPALSLSFSGGKMDGEGNYTAGDRPGEYQVSASYGEKLKATALVVIKGSLQKEKTQVKIWPPQATLQPGEQTQFRFSVYDEQGLRTQANLQISLAGGKIDSQGVFTAGEVPGNYELTVATEDGSSSATAKIVILGTTPQRDPLKTSPQSDDKPGKIIKFAIIPHKVELYPGSSCRFSFVATDNYGKTSTPALKLRFSGGKLNNNGVFIAGNRPGKYTLSAETDDGLSATAEIHILGDSGNTQVQEIPAKQPGPLARLVVKPERIRLRRGDTCKFEIIGMDEQGNRVPAQLSWSYHGGILRADGTFVAKGMPGQYNIILDGPRGISARAIVAIVPDPPIQTENVWILIDPPRITLKPGESFRYNCRVVDDYGNDLGRNKLEWQTLGGTWNPETLVFTAGNEIGDFYLRARYSEYVVARVYISIERE